MGDTSLNPIFDNTLPESWSPSFGYGTPGAINSNYLILNNKNSENTLPNVFVLNQNYPNTFNPITTISYALSKNTMVRIKICNILGQLIKNLIDDIQTSGYKSIRWNATNNANESVSAGLYLYTIQAGEFRQTKKMVLLK